MKSPSTELFSQSPEALLLSWHYHCGNWQECLKHYLLFVHHEPSGLGQFPCQFQTSTVWAYKEAGWAVMDAVLGCKKVRISVFALLSFLSFNRLIPVLFLSAPAPLPFLHPKHHLLLRQGRTSHGDSRNFVASLHYIKAGPKPSPSCLDWARFLFVGKWAPKSQIFH